MSDIVNTATIKVVTDGSEVQTGMREVANAVGKTVGQIEESMRQVDAAAAKTGRTLDSIGKQSGLRGVGDGADAAAVRVDRSTKNMADAIQRTTATMDAGRKGTVEYFKSLASQRGIDVNALKPFLDQLEQATRRTEEAAAAQRKLEASTKFLEELRSRADGIGKTASQMAELRAAQLGVSESAAPMIAQLRAAERGSGSLGTALGELKGKFAALAAGVSVGALAHAVLESQREFDKLNSSLITATGSTANAKQAFAALQQFASTTPYSLKDATEAFIKMKNLGLDPSERALRSYGNTAAAMGKDLNQMIEAVADASTGEFERLKEFGIIAKQNGDRVSLTFKGMTTNIGNNAKEIQAYLRNIGETDFGGGMELRANTLDGAISNIGDTWQSVLRTIAQNGIGDAMLSGVLAVTAALGDLKAILDAVGGAAHKEGEAVKEAGVFHKAVTTVFETIAVLGVNVAYVFEQVGKEFGGLAAQAQAVLSGNFKEAGAIGDMMKKDAEEARKAVDAKTDAILNASTKAQAAQDAETENAKKNGEDRLEQFKEELTAAQKRDKALNDTLELRNKLNGVDAQTAGNLKKLKEALDTGAISQAEYNRYVAQVNKESTQNLTTYKNVVKQIDLQTEALERLTEARVFDNQQAQLQIEFLKRTGQLSEEDAIDKSADADIATLRQKKQVLEDEAKLQAKKIENEGKVRDLMAKAKQVDKEIDARELKRDNDKFELDQKRYNQAINNYADLLDAAQAESKVQRDRVRDQQDEIDMLGMTSKQIAQVTAKRLQDRAATLEQRAAILDMADASGRLGDELRDQAESFRKQADQVLNKDVLMRQKELWKQIEDTAHDTFISIFDSGKSAFDRLRDTLKNGLYELLYQLTVKKWLINIGASYSGGQESSIATLLNSMGSSGGGASSSNGTISAVQSASSFYSAGKTIYAGFQGGFSSGMSSLATSFGKLVGFGSASSAGTAAASTTGIVGAEEGGAVAASTATTAGGAGAGAASAGYAVPIAGWIAFGMAMSDRFYKQGWDANNGSVNSLGKVVNAPMFLANNILKGIGLSDSQANILVGMGPISKLFGRKNPEIESQGLEGTLSASGFSGDMYANILEKGGWFRSDKRYTKTADLSAAQDASLDSTIKAMMLAVDGFASTLGVSTDSINGYSKAIKLELTGDATKDQEAIAKLFGDIGDELSKKLVPSIDQFTKTGETASSTLQRLAGDFLATNQVAQLIGKTAAEAFGTAGFESAKAREQLIGLAGDVSTLTSQAQSYAQNYLTDAEKLAPVQKALDAAMASLGLSAVQTRDQFKAVVNSLDLTTEAGAKEFTSLMALADAFAQVHPSTEAAAAALAQVNKGYQDQIDELLKASMTAEQVRAMETAGMDASTIALYDRLAALKAEAAAIEAQKAAIESVKSAATSLLGNVDNAYSVLQKVVGREKDLLQQRIDSETAAVGRLQDLSQSIHSTLDSFKVPGTEAFARQSAQAQIRDASAAMRGGASLSDDQIAGLKKAFGVVTQDSSSQFSSYTDYLRDLYTTQNDIAALGDVTDSQLSTEQESLKALQDQSKYLDGILTSAQDQIDQLKGLSTIGLDIQGALHGLEVAISSAQQNPVVSATSAVNEAYQKYLGRAPDTAGLAFYQDKAASGVSTSAIVNSIGTSAESIQKMYRDLLGRSADAGGLSFFSNSGATADAITAAIKASDEYKRLHPFAVGTNYVPQTMPALVHEGERIIPAADNRELMRRLSSPSENSSALVAELRASREENARMRALLEQIAGSTKQAADHIEGVTNGGTVMNVESI